MQEMRVLKGFHGFIDTTCWCICSICPFHIWEVEITVYQNVRCALEILDRFGELLERLAQLAGLRLMSRRLVVWLSVNSTDQQVFFVGVCC